MPRPLDGCIRESAGCVPTGVAGNLQRAGPAALADVSGIPRLLLGRIGPGVPGTPLVGDLEAERPSPGLCSGVRDAPTSFRHSDIHNVGGKEDPSRIGRLRVQSIPGRPSRRQIRSHVIVAREDKRSDSSAYQLLVPDQHRAGVVEVLDPARRLVWRSLSAPPPRRDAASRLGCKKSLGGKSVDVKQHQYLDHARYKNPWHTRVPNSNRTRAIHRRAIRAYLSVQMAHLSASASTGRA